MDNKSYAKCRLCEYKGGCAFNHNGDQELCELNVTYLDLSAHDKQIRDEIYQQGMADERKRIIKELEEEKNISGRDLNYLDYIDGINKAIEIARGGENE